MGARHGLSLCWILLGRPCSDRAGPVLLVAALLVSLASPHNAFCAPPRGAADGRGARSSPLSPVLARSTVFGPVAPPTSASAATEDPGPQDLDDGEGDDLTDGPVPHVGRTTAVVGVPAATVMERLGCKAMPRHTRRALAGPGAPRAPPAGWVA
jgi:hypothetical protein